MSGLNLDLAAPPAGALELGKTGHSASSWLGGQKLTDAGGDLNSAGAYSISILSGASAATMLATGEGGVVLGRNATAGIAGTAVGGSNAAGTLGPVAGTAAVAIGAGHASYGVGANASNFGVAIGTYSRTDRGVAVGFKSNSDGINYGTAVGYEAQATTGSYTSAFGSAASAINTAAISIGGFSDANGEGSVALGGGTVATSADGAQALAKQSVAICGYSTTYAAASVGAAGTYGVAIGAGATVLNAGQVIIGAVSTGHALYPNQVGIGYNVQVLGSNGTNIGSNSYSTQANASAFGYNSRAGAYGTACGFNAEAESFVSTALGCDALADAGGAMALGGSYNLAQSTKALAVASTAIGCGTLSGQGGATETIKGAVVGTSGIGSTAIGIGTNVDTAHTWMIHGFGAAPKAASETDWTKLAGAQIIITSPIIDFKSVADTELTLPTGLHFLCDEVDMSLTSADTITVQPTLRLGTTASNEAYRAAAVTSGLTAAYHRQIFTNLLSQTGVTSLHGGVTVGATATTMSGRLIFKGYVLEDE